MAQREKLSEIEKEEKIIGLIKIIVNGRTRESLRKEMELIPDKESGKIITYLRNGGGKFIHPVLLISALQNTKYRGKNVDIETQIPEGYADAQTLKTSYST